MNREDRAWWALTGLCLGMTLLYMNTTMVTQAVPVFTAALHASSTQLEWLVSAYNLAFLAVLLPAGALGDRYGQRRILLTGITIFGASAALIFALDGAAEFTTTTTTTATALTAGIIATRVAMGLGASVFTPMSLSLLPRLFPPQTRPVATSLWTVSGVLGAPIGILLGGWLIDAFGWPSIFTLDAIISAAVFGMCVAFIPPHKHPATPPHAPTPTASRFPAWQTATSMAAFALITWGLVNAAASWLNPQTWVPLTLGLTLATLFCWQTHRAHFPLADLRLLTNPRYGAAALTLGTVNLVLFGMLYITPQYFQTVLGFSAFSGGLLLLPMVVTATTGSFLAAKIRNTTPPRWLLPAAMAAMSVGNAISAFTQPTTPVPTIMGLSIMGLGMGACQSLAFDFAMEAVPLDRRASGAALINAIRQLGALLGTALLGTLTTTLYQHFTRHTPLPTPADVFAHQSYAHALDWIFATCAVLTACIAAGLAASTRGATHGHTTQT